MATTDSLPSYPHPDYAEIVVVRHGETAWNSQGRVQDFQSLTSFILHRIRQILGECLYKIDFRHGVLNEVLNVISNHDSILLSFETSDADFTKHGQVDIELNETGRQQAVAVANRLSREPKISAIYSSDLQRAFETAQIIAVKCGGLEVVKDLDLRERHMGDLQGHPYRELATTNPIGYEALESKNDDRELPGGGESFVQLFERCKSALLKIGRKHKGERVVVVTHGASIETLYRWANATGRYKGKIDNASIAVFRLYGEDKWTLNMKGDVSHLCHNGFLQPGFEGDTTTT
ncbi:Phosphoglycerate mutase-like protein 4 [Glycine soja]